MVAKKVLILFSLTSVVNLATYEDFNEENPKNSIVEEDISINKNNWNTRKWGSFFSRQCGGICLLQDFAISSIRIYLFFV